MSTTPAPSSKRKAETKKLAAAFRKRGLSKAKIEQIVDLTTKPGETSKCPPPG